jgi:hypothetical protein
MIPEIVSTSELTGLSLYNTVHLPHTHSEIMEQVCPQLAKQIAATTIMSITCDF